MLYNQQWTLQCLEQRAIPWHELVWKGPFRHWAGSDLWIQLHRWAQGGDSTQGEEWARERIVCEGVIGKWARERERKHSQGKLGSGTGRHWWGHVHISEQLPLVTIRIQLPTFQNLSGSDTSNPPSPGPLEAGLRAAWGPHRLGSSRPPEQAPVSVGSLCPDLIIANSTKY